MRGTRRDASFSCRPSSVWVVAPPKRWTRPPTETFRVRRAELMRRIGQRSIAVLRGQPDLNRIRMLLRFNPTFTGDSFKQEENLFYLTGLETPNARNQRRPPGDGRLRA